MTVRGEPDDIDCVVMMKRDVCCDGWEDCWTAGVMISAGSC